MVCIDLGMVDIHRGITEGLFSEMLKITSRRERQSYGSWGGEEQSIRLWGTKNYKHGLAFYVGSEVAISKSLRLRTESRGRAVRST